LEKAVAALLIPYPGAYRALRRPLVNVCHGMLKKSTPSSHALAILQLRNNAEIMMCFQHRARPCICRMLRSVYNDMQISH
jgi:hypothetical protein